MTGPASRCPALTIIPMFVFLGPRCSLSLHMVTAPHLWTKWTAWTSCLPWASLSTHSSATLSPLPPCRRAWEPTVSISLLSCQRMNRASTGEDALGWPKMFFPKLSAIEPEGNHSWLTRLSQLTSHSWGLSMGFITKHPSRDRRGVRIFPQEG